MEPRQEQEWEQDWRKTSQKSCCYEEHKKKGKVQPTSRVILIPKVCLVLGNDKLSRWGLVHGEHHESRRDDTNEGMMTMAHTYGRG